jgi:2-methylcitrate dehydratase PrpD
VRSQGARPDSSVVGADFKTSAWLAALVNATTGHALEYDDIASGGGSHPASPMTAASLAVGEKVGASGRSVILAWLVGWEITRQTGKPCNREAHTHDGPRVVQPGLQSALSFGRGGGFGGARRHPDSHALGTAGR